MVCPPKQNHASTRDSGKCLRGRTGPRDLNTCRMMIAKRCWKSFERPNPVCPIIGVSNNPARDRYYSHNSRKTGSLDRILHADETKSSVRLHDRIAPLCTLIAVAHLDSAHLRRFEKTRSNLEVYGRFPD